MEPDWRCLKEDGVTFAAIWNVSSSDKQVNAADALACRNPQRDFWCGNGNDLSHGALHHHGISQVDEMQSHRVLLFPQSHIENAFALDSHLWRFVCGPFDRVAQK